MNNLKIFFDYILNFKRTNNVSIDVCHNLLLFGTILSHKPENVLELGIGNGYVTRSIIHALDYNQKGHLESVDNNYDGNVTPDFIKELLLLSNRFLDFKYSSEEDFVKKTPDNIYDLLVSDADHRNSGNWTSDIFRIVKNDGIIFVHDIFYTESVKRYLDVAKELKKPYFLFSSSSRDDEGCESGWLMIKNEK